MPYLPTQLALSSLNQIACFSLTVYQQTVLYSIYLQEQNNTTTTAVNYNISVSKIKAQSKPGFIFLLFICLFRAV
jgi:hypothetical protein